MGSAGSSLQFFSSCTRGATVYSHVRLLIVGLLFLQSMGCRVRTSVIMAYGLNCSAVCGIFLDQGLNPCSLHWQVDSYSTEPPGEYFTFLSFTGSPPSLDSSPFLPGVNLPDTSLPILMSAGPVTCLHRCSVHFLRNKNHYSIFQCFF